MTLPMTPLAGEHDARAVSANPGGLALIRGTELALALDLEDPDVATSAGPGLRRVRRDRDRRPVDPEVRARRRARVARARARRSSLPIPMTRSGSRSRSRPRWPRPPGSAWRGITSTPTACSAASTRSTSGCRRGGATTSPSAGRCAMSRPTKLGGVPVQRRYELEALLRPLGTDALELALGGRVGETRHDVDGWAHVAARVARGVIVHAGVETRELHAIIDSNLTGRTEEDGRDWRAMIGLELSFGWLRRDRVRHRSARRHRRAATRSAARWCCGRRPRGRRRCSARRITSSASSSPATIGLRELTSLVVRLRAIARDPYARRRSSSPSTARAAAGPRSRSCARDPRASRRPARRCSRTSSRGPARTTSSPARPTRSTSTPRAAADRRPGRHHDVLPRARSISSACCRSSRRSPSTRARPSSSPRRARPSRPRTCTTRSSTRCTSKWVDARSRPRAS